MWTFIGSKAFPVWLWLAICRRTKQIVGWSVGERDDASCEHFKETIEPEYQKCQTVSDYWSSYERIFGEEHKSCGKESGETAHVERKNNVLRQRLAYLVRKTLSFAKKAEHLVLVLYLFILSHNRDIFLSVTT